MSKFSYPERGGIETFVRDLSTEQARQGHEVTVLCHQARPWSRTKHSVVDSVSIIQAGIIGSFAFAPIALRFPLLLWRLLMTRRPDVVHLHLPNPAVLFLAWLPTSIPLVIHWHADVEGQPGRFLSYLYPIYRYFEHRCLSHASKIIATSLAYAQSSPTLASYQEKCVVVPLGLDPARYPESPDVAKMAPPLILSVGRFAYYKGYTYLVQAAQKIPSARFMLVGDGPLREKILSQVKDLNLNERVILPGNLSDHALQKLLQQATLLCLPSVDRGEAFGVVQLEAMRYGLPIVSTAIPGSGVDWVNQDGSTGQIVQSRSSSELATAIKELLHKPQKLEHMAKAGRRRFAENFTIERIATALDRIYRQVLKPACER